jgi:hypothetical protein
MKCSDCNNPALCDYCENGELTAEGKEKEKEHIAKISLDNRKGK